MIRNIQSKLQKWFWMLKKDFKSTDFFIRIKDNKKVISPNKELHNIFDVKICTTIGAAKNFVKLIFEDNEELYLEMTLDGFLELTNQDKNYLQISKSTIYYMPSCKERLNSTFLFFNNIAFKIGVTYLPDVLDWFKQEYDC